jgi:phosphoserine phosphatase RsbU/P
VRVTVFEPEDPAPLAPAPNRRAVHPIVKLNFVAGHEPPLVRHAAADRTSEFEVTGPALGLWIDQAWQVRTEQLQPGDSLLGFTDGVTEAIGSGGPVGSDLLRHALEEHTGPATGLIDAVRMQFESPVDQVVVNDDITLLALTRLAPSPFGRGVG